MFSIDDLEQILKIIEENQTKESEFTFINGETRDTDIGYAFEGIRLFIEELKRIPNQNDNCCDDCEYWGWLDMCGVITRGCSMNNCYYE